MTYIIYADRVNELEGNKVTVESLKERFEVAIKINKDLIAKDCKIAYMFIDPLLDSFEAANHFYFDVLECTDVSMLNVYRSGCGPVQALSDAKMLIDNNIVNAVFVFGHEPLASIKQNVGKEIINNGMSIFGDTTIPSAYNKLTHELLKTIEMNKEQFLSVATLLHDNYQKSYKNGDDKIEDVNKKPDRKNLLDSMNADLFTLTDCANPNIDFTGGLIIANKEIADCLEIPNEDRIEIIGAKYNVVADGPNNIKAIVGEKGNIFPHLEKAYFNACLQGEVNFRNELKTGNAFMEVYTCYPPIPIAFLLASKMIDSIDEIADFLQEYEITLTGGLNLARAPWNNPALNALIALYQKIRVTEKEYGLVHGNGGLGGLQGVAILKKSCK